MEEHLTLSEKAVIVRLLADGNLENAIVEAFKLVGSAQYRHYKNLVLLSFSLHTLEEAIVNNRIDYSIEYLEKNKLASSFLAILEKLPTNHLQPS